MGEMALRSHVDGKKRKKRLEDHGHVKNLFQPKNATYFAKEPNPRPKPVIIITTVDSVPAAGSTSSAACYTKSVDYCFQHSVCQKTEIMRVLEDVYNGLSENSTKNVVDLFKTMFPDSKAAKQMQLKLSKLKYVVNHGTAPYIQDILK